MIFEREQDYPEKKAVKTWEHNGNTLSIVHTHMGHYCGYVRFTKPPLTEEDEDYLIYIPIHGGITYNQLYKNGSRVYGFDCNHSGDSDNPKLKDIGWLTNECQMLETWIEVAAKYEAEYLRSEPEEKLNVIQKCYDEMTEKTGKTFDPNENFLYTIKHMF